MPVSKFKARDMEVDRGTGCVGRENARASTFKGFHVIDRDIVLKQLVIVEAAIDRGHAILFQADEFLTATRQSAHRVIVRHRSGRALDKDARDHFEYINGGARRLLVQIRGADGGDGNRGIQQSALRGRSRHHDGLEQIRGGIVRRGRRGRSRRRCRGGRGRIRCRRFIGRALQAGLVSTRAGRPGAVCDGLDHQHARAVRIDLQLGSRQQHLHGVAPRYEFHAAPASSGP